MRNAHRTTNGIVQQGCSELDAWGPMVNGQPGQYHTGMESGMSLRTLLVASWYETAPAAIA